MRSTAVPTAQHSPPERSQEAAEQGEPHTHSPVPTEEEGVSRGFPPDGRVNAVIGDALPIGDQGLWVAGLQVGFSEEPVPVTYRGKELDKGDEKILPSCCCGRCTNG